MFLFCLCAMFHLIVQSKLIMEELLLLGIESNKTIISSIKLIIFLQRVPNVCILCLRLTSSAMLPPLTAVLPTNGQRQPTAVVWCCC